MQVMGRRPVYCTNRTAFWYVDPVLKVPIYERTHIPNLADCKEGVCMFCGFRGPIRYSGGPYNGSVKLPRHMPNLDVISVAIENLTGADSIPTIERVYEMDEDERVYVCPWPGCAELCSTPEGMWLHVHTLTQVHGQTVRMDRDAFWLDLPFDGGWASFNKERQEAIREAVFAPPKPTITVRDPEGLLARTRGATTTASTSTSAASGTDAATRKASTPTAPTSPRVTNADAPPSSEPRKRRVYRIGDQCPDDGRCHHDCEPIHCYRVDNAAPLTGVYPDDKWPRWMDTPMCETCGTTDHYGHAGRSRMMTHDQVYLFVMTPYDEREYTI